MKRIVLILTLLLEGFPLLAQAPPRMVTVPVTFDHNRIIIDVFLPLADGTQKRVRGWVDNGNAELWMDDRVAKLLNVEITAPAGDTLGAKVQLGKPPREIFIGGLKLPLTGIPQVKIISAESIAPGSSAEINLPASLLRRFDILVDFPNR